MKSHPCPALVFSLSISLLIHGMGCCSSGSSTADVKEPAAPPEYLPTREALNKLDTGAKVIVVHRDSTMLMGWFEGIEEPCSGSTGIIDGSLFRIVLRYNPEYGTFQRKALLVPDSILNLRMASDDSRRPGIALLGFVAATISIIAIAIAGYDPW